MKHKEFLQIVMPFKNKMFRIAKRLLTSTEEAEDATQEILMKLWVNHKKIESFKSVEAFSMQMIKNYCLDRLKSKQAKHLKLVHSNYNCSVSVPKQIELKDSVHWVEEIIKKLPPNQKMILQLRDVEGYSFEEIEKILEINPITVRVTLSRARKAVRTALVKKHSYGVC